MSRLFCLFFRERAENASFVVLLFFPDVSSVFRFFGMCTAGDFRWLSRVFSRCLVCFACFFGSGRRTRLSESCYFFQRSRLFFVFLGSALPLITHGFRDFFRHVSSVFLVFPEAAGERILRSVVIFSRCLVCFSFLWAARCL